MAAGAGAGGGAGTQGGDWARDGAGRQTNFFLEIIKQVLVLLRGFGAAAEREDPAEVQVELGAEAGGQIHSTEDVRAVGQYLAEPGAAKVLQGGGGVAGTDHLHTAFSCRGANHGVELLVLQHCGSNTCKREEEHIRVKNKAVIATLKCSWVLWRSLLELERNSHLCSAGSCRKSGCHARCRGALL